MRQICPITIVGPVRNGATTIERRTDQGAAQEDGQDRVRQLLKNVPCGVNRQGIPQLGRRPTGSLLRRTRHSSAKVECIDETVQPSKWSTPSRACTEYVNPTIAEYTCFIDLTNITAPSTGNYSGGSALKQLGVSPKMLAVICQSFASFMTAREHAYRWTMERAPNGLMWERDSGRDVIWHLCSFTSPFAALLMFSFDEVSEDEEVMADMIKVKREVTKGRGRMLN